MVGALMLECGLARLESFPCVAEGGPSYLRAPRLLDRVRTAIRTRHLSPRTEEAYIFWIRRFILFHHKRGHRGVGVGPPLVNSRGIA